ncbi:MAG: acylneuraminate cytidylyltransferase family protein, partial [Pseudomonadota bacterium]
IDQAKATPGIDRIIVSTDSPDIAQAAKEAGAEVPFLRPAELASNTAGKLDVWKHLLAWVEDDMGPVSEMIDLDPTSPLRDVADITACIDMLSDPDTDLVITGYEADKNPYFNMVEHKADGTVELVKSPDTAVLGRQGAPKVYAMNASVYAWRRAAIGGAFWSARTKLHIMPRARSVDIDDPIDFELVQLLMARKHHPLGASS